MTSCLLPAERHGQEVVELFREIGLDNDMFVNTIQNMTNLFSIFSPRVTIKWEDKIKYARPNRYVRCEIALLYGSHWNVSFNTHQWFEKQIKYIASAIDPAIVKRGSISETSTIVNVLTRRPCVLCYDMPPDFHLCRKGNKYV